MAVQADSWPTRKLATMVVGTPTLYALTGDAVREVWPQLVPAGFSGPATTAFVAVLLSTILAGAAAWFVPDRPNVPTE